MIFDGVFPFSQSVWVPVSKEALLQTLKATPLLFRGHVFDSNSSAIVFFLSLLSGKIPTLFLKDRI